MISDYKILREIEKAENFIDKSYLNNLNEYNIIDLPERDKNYRHIRLNRIEKIMYDIDENITDKLISVYNAAMPFANNVVMIIKGGVQQAEIYLGVKSKINIGIAQNVLSDSFISNFSGSKLAALTTQETENLLSFQTFKNNNEKYDSAEAGVNIACINLVPDLRGQRTEKFVQGMEKFIDTMKGQEYICEILATPLTNEDITNRRNGFEQLYSALYPISKKTMSHGHNEGKTLTEGISESFSDSISNGISLATGTNQSNMKGKNNGFNIGAHMLLNFGFMNGSSEGSTAGTSRTDTTTETRAKQSMFGKNLSESVTTGTTDNISVEHKDKSIENLLKKIDKHLERLNDSVSYGLYESAAYFISNNKKTVAIAASTFHSIMLGEATNSEQTHLNMFGIEHGNKTETILRSLSYCEHPKFEIPFSENQNNTKIVTPTNYISGKEIAVLMNIPRKSVSGILVSEMAEFGRNIYSDLKGEKRQIEIGSIFHMGNIEPTTVKLDIDMLTSHCFVTGSTGSGKSNTVYKLIEELNGHPYNIPFLIIEPAKGEYRKEFGGIEDINIFSTNHTIGEFLKLNPFYFNSNIHILEHLDRLIEIFNACWEMYAAMPAILKDAIEQTYINKGWDLLNSIYVKGDVPEYPTFADLLTELPRVINKSGYSSDTKGDYIGALVTRVNSLTNGIYGQIFCDDFEIDERTLFDSKTIVDLSRVGSSETKSLIMGIIILKLSEYRMAQPIESNSKLRHVTILEEAHNLLKNTQNNSTFGNNVVAKSIEMITNSIAEMRTYGEGFIIVDQSPTSVDIAAIKNTNTKIIMRLPEKEDCDLIGKSVSLKDSQISELSKLSVGVAVVMQNNWGEAVLSKIDSASHSFIFKESAITFSKLKEFRETIIAEILNQYVLSDKRDTAAIYNKIESFDISHYKKAEMKRYIDSLCGNLNREFNSILLGRSLLKIACCSDAFKMAEKKLQSDDKGDYIPDSLENWNYNIDKDLSAYVSLEDEYKNILIQYILWSKSFETHAIDYRRLYEKIYDIK